jgi:pimeloyl-ACP methyl ester carboxylesterase
MKMKHAIAAIVLLVQAGGSAQPQPQSQPPTPDAIWQKLDAYLSFGRKRAAQDYAIAGTNRIDEGRYVTLGGIEQWITIRGENRANPVLLFLHGGPGDATNPWGHAGFRTWVKTFTVVQWDQRGSGRTLGKSGPSVAPTITIDRMAQDGNELAELLRKSLQKDKILLVGHSWGSILGVHMVKARPELFSAYVGTGQVGNSPRNYAVAYDALVQKATQLGDRQALAELKEVGPPPYENGRGYGVQRKWSNFFEGADFFIGSMFGIAMHAPGYTPQDIIDWFDGQVLSADRLVPQTRSLDPKAMTGDFAVPVHVIQGTEDFTTPTSLARDFVASLHAPRKSFSTIPGAGHFAVFMKPAAFLAELQARVDGRGRSAAGNDPNREAR